MDFDLRAGETLGVVGESGSGKSVTMMSLLGLLPRSAMVTGTAVLDGSDLLAMSERQVRHVRGSRVGFVFQDPMTSLNPVDTLGAQIGEAIRIHHREVSRSAAAARAVELLRIVGVGNPEGRAKQYPHEFSGGMRQRAMIAMAIANKPEVIIADEPTTALDVTIQAQVIDVLQAAQRETGAAVILISHDLGLVAEVADHIVVMYSGRVVESGRVRDIFDRPRHPYTKSLLECLPSLDTADQRLKTIPGEPPDPSAPRRGCSFVDRCWLSHGREICRTQRPELIVVEPGGSESACHFHAEIALDRARTV
ncbi:MAG: ABC transporter ATP-binding protein [Jatrophihabitans sp.]